jgi:hypothetical protein
MERQIVNQPTTDIWYAATREDTVDAAVSELQSSFGGRYISLLFVFFSPQYDAAKLAQALSNTFSPVPVIGCTTAGEISPEGMVEGSIVAVGFSTETFAFAPRLIQGLEQLSVQDVGTVVRDALHALDRRVGSLGSADTFAIMLADGLSQKEDQLAAAFYGALRGAPLVGGSAADHMAFDRTKIIYGGHVYEDAAALVVARTPLPFCAFSSDHYLPTPIRLVVTSADSDKRLVYELNAAPAAKEYAAAVEMPCSELTAASFAEHPLAVRVGGEFFARAIRGIEKRGALSFMSAVDEGVVFTIVEPGDLIGSVEGLLDDIRGQIGQPQLILGFECLFRRLEFERSQMKQAVSAIYAANNVVGFHTYGEQFRAMHLNQTLTGLAIGPR